MVWRELLLSVLTISYPLHRREFDKLGIFQPLRTDSTQQLSENSAGKKIPSTSCHLQIHRRQQNPTHSYSLYKRAIRTRKASTTVSPIQMAFPGNLRPTYITRRARPMVVGVTDVHSEKGHGIGHNRPINSGLIRTYGNRESASRRLDKN